MNIIDELRLIDGNNIDIPNLKNLDWFKIVRRNNSPLFSSLIRMGLLRQHPDFEFQNTIKSQAILNNDIYAVNEEVANLSKNIIDLAEKDGDFLDRYFTLVRKDNEGLIHFAKEVGAKDWKDAKTSDLLSFFQEFIVLSLRMTTHMYPPLGPEDWLVEEIQKELSSKINDPNVLAKILNDLISPDDMSMIQERDESILKLAICIKENDFSDREVSSRINALYEKYGWVPDDTFRFKYHDVSYFDSEISNVLEKDAKTILDSFEKERDLLTQKKQSIIEEYSLTARTIHLCLQASELPHIRNLRREAIPEAAFHMRTFFQVLFNKLGTNRLTDYFHWEIVDVLKGGKINMEKIDDRPSGFGLVFIDESLYIGDRAGAESVKKVIDKPVEDTDEIRGTVACFGKTTGIARVLFSSDEINRVEEGDILVTAMTTPDFVPAMKKCAAVVTDEGGISCHASIVAREMKKPCIIGTKVATQIIKDGDYIEVDAENGIVRKVVQ